jgi:hypothetical protein
MTFAALCSPDSKREGLLIQRSDTRVLVLVRIKVAMTQCISISYDHRLYEYAGAPVLHISNKVQNWPRRVDQQLFIHYC